ncbi:MAG: S8/S53 family peptidase, partial [Proteobacteria bacterium]|nr:S8/S53 family peptidase [Pseudomonadota bacterium]
KTDQHNSNAKNKILPQTETLYDRANDGTPYQVSSPACIPEATSVGATDSVTHAITAFSNGARSLDLLAPGQNIGIPYFAIAPAENEVVLAGASFSAPLVTGEWAALKSHKPKAKY